MNTYSLKESQTKWHKPGFIFRTGRAPVNGRTIGNKNTNQVYKNATTGTYHLFGGHPLHKLWNKSCHTMRWKKIKKVIKREPKFAFENVTNNIGQREKRETTDLFLAHWQPFIWQIVFLKYKNKWKNISGRVAGSYIRIGFNKRNR